MQNERLLFEQKKFSDMGNMIDAIAHQWKQPLNNLYLHSQYLFDNLRKGRLDDEILALEKDISSLIEFMNKTISDFRDFLRKDTQENYFYLSDTVDETIQLLKSQLMNHTIAIEVNKPEKDICILGHQSELKQVIMNLIVNAKESFEAKGITSGRKITITISDSDRISTVEFKDNAGGIPDNILEKIYHPYFTTKAEGSGIGLYISKMIINDLFKGDIKHQNENEGTVALITIPKTI